MHVFVPHSDQQSAEIFLCNMQNGMASRAERCPLHPTWQTSAANKETIYDGTTFGLCFLLDCDSS